MTIEQLLALIGSVQPAQAKSNVNQPGAKQYVTKKTAAGMLDVTVRTVENYVRDGKLTKCIRGANRVVLLRNEVEALVKEWHN